jgi:5-dehydro-2-deoxygluconokinase
MAHEGSYLWHQGEMAYAPGYNVEVIEPTGAGDAFTAALCMGFLHDWPLMKIARYANAAGALAVGAVGHLGKALPTFADVEILLNHNP